MTSFNIIKLTTNIRLNTSSRIFTHFIPPSTILPVFQRLLNQTKVTRLCVVISSYKTVIKNLFSWTKFFWKAQFVTVILHKTWLQNASIKIIKQTGNFKRKQLKILYIGNYIGTIFPLNFGVHCGDLTRLRLEITYVKCLPLFSGNLYSRWWIIIN